jgi:hypothetical protein
LPPEYLLGGLNLLTHDARDLYQNREGQFAAPSSAFQGLIGGTIGASSPVFGSATNALNQTLSGDYLNSISDRISPQLSVLQNQIRKGIDSQFAGAGRYGSGLHQGAIAEAENNAATNLFGNLYNQERGYQQQALGLAPQYTQQGINAGLLQQNFAQQQADSRLRPLQQYSNFLFPQLGSGSSTTSPIYNNPTAGFLGGALAGNQLYKSFGGGGGGGGGGYGGAPMWQNMYSYGVDQ